MKRSEFNLSNKQWRQDTGRLLHEHNLQNLQKRKNMAVVYDRLSEATSRTGFVGEYLRHVQARMETAPEMMQVKTPRRWRFTVYQKEQRAVKKLATSLLGGLWPSNTIIVWGNGGVGPTSRGPPRSCSFYYPKASLLSLVPRPVHVIMEKCGSFHLRRRPLVAR